MIARIKNTAGLALTEALLAISVLTTGVLVLGSIIQNAVSSTLVSRDYLVAENLATEGLEGVKMIRDTNWLKFPKDKNCWLSLDDDSDDVCSVKVASEERFIVQTVEGWKLESVGGSGLNLDSTSESDNILPYTLYLKETNVDDPDTAEVEKIKYLAASATAISGAKASGYFREIYFVEVTDDLASYRVNIQWEDGSKTRTLSREAVIYNYRE
ncbi:MAG: hypothetical protein AAB373_00295 [Patescibacteria group bacterium]